jgi:alpha-beta hydrolase superfamily lysophospholipase
VIAAAIAAGCGHAPAPPATLLRAPDGLACRAYVVAGREPVTDVFLSMGGTGTGTSAFVPDALRDVLATRSAALVTFDKPGVTATFGDPASAQIDDGPFQQHTEGSLLACAHEALALSRARFGSGVRWHLRGHSEGALLALFLYDDLLAEGPEAAAPVKTLILSGLPLEPFAELVRRQLADKPRLATGIARCDWSVMRGLGVSCVYLRDAERRPSGRTMFERLAARSAPARIVVFAGRADVNTPARFVHELEAWNTEQGHLPLEIHDYAGEHRGSTEARHAMSDLLRALVP